MIDIEKIIESVLEAHLIAMDVKYGDFWIRIGDFIERVNKNFESMKIPYKYKFVGRVISIKNLTHNEPDLTKQAVESEEPSNKS